MSTGPEHYTEAERLLRAVAARVEGPMTVEEARGVEVVTAVAQGHATLALAAATALASTTIQPGEADWRPWYDAAGSPEKSFPWA